METRININQLEPAAYKAMYGLEAYLAQTGLTHTQKDLLKIRASQINNCAFCIDMHIKEALKAGESDKRIYVLTAWKETNLFTAEEQALLAVTEEVTLIHKKGLTEETYLKALQHFTKNQLAQIIIAIATINAWNRIAVSTEMGFGI